MDRPETATTILDAAQRITQAVGYNGLSFRDVAAAVGVKSASVHHHFPTKAILGAALARRYTDRLMADLEALQTSGRAPVDLLRDYVEAFRRTLESQGKMCLGGMLAVEADAVPPEVRAEVLRFIERNISWIAAVLVEGKPSSQAVAAAHQRAQALFAALEGAMLVARGTGDIAVFDAIVATLSRSGLLPPTR